MRVTEPVNNLLRPWRAFLLLTIVFSVSSSVLNASPFTENTGSAIDTKLRTSAELSDVVATSSGLIKDQLFSCDLSWQPNDDEGQTCILNAMEASVVWKTKISSASSRTKTCETARPGSIDRRCEKSNRCDFFESANEDGGSTCYAVAYRQKTVWSGNLSKQEYGSYEKADYGFCLPKVPAKLLTSCGGDIYRKTSAHPYLKKDQTCTCHPVHVVYSGGLEELYPDTWGCALVVGGQYAGSSLFSRTGSNYDDEDITSAQDCQRLCVPHYVKNRNWYEEVCKQEIDYDSQIYQDLRTPDNTGVNSVKPQSNWPAKR